MLLYLGFLLSIFLDYVRPGSYVPAIEVLHLNSIVPLTVLVATIFSKEGADQHQIFKHRNTLWLVFFLFLLAISVLTADVTELSFTIFKTVLGFLFWYYIITRLITTEQRLRGLFATLVVCHVLLLLLNPQLVLNPEERSYIQGNAFFGDGNDYSLSVAIVLPFCLYLIIKSKSFTLRAIWIVSFAALLLGTVGTQSRGAALALVAIFIFLWWKGRKKVMGLALIGAVLVAILSYAPEVYFQRLGTIKDYEQESSAMGRIMAWKTAMRMAEKYPLLGVGSGHFAVKLGTEFRPAEFGNRNLPWLTAHSMYFLLIGELGIPGITFLLSMLIGNFLINNRLAREAWNNKSELTTLFLMLNASLLAFATGGAFLSAAYYPHLYVLAGIWTAAYFIHKGGQSEHGKVLASANPETPDQRAERLVWGAGNDIEKQKFLE